MYRAYQEGNLPEGSRIVPTVRELANEQEFLEKVNQGLQDHLSQGEYNKKDWQKFSVFIKPLALNVTEVNDGWKALKAMLETDSLDKSRVFYLSLPPAVYGSCSEVLSQMNLITTTSRVVVEKPIGYCGESAEVINAKVAEYFEEIKSSVLIII